MTPGGGECAYMTRGKLGAPRLHTIPLGRTPEWPIAWKRKFESKKNGRVSRQPIQLVDTQATRTQVNQKVQSVAQIF